MLENPSMGSGTIDRLPPSGMPGAMPIPAAAPQGGGVLSYARGGRVQRTGGIPDAVASQGPGGSPFTPAMADRANDLTTTAKGVAAENPPAPQIRGAGNPVGAPMLGRVAVGPSSPIRNYGKPKGVLSYDDGGMVGSESDGTDQQGASSATFDPMSMVKQALAYGRQKMGLPAQFESPDATPAFDDGGVVPSGDDVIEGGNAQQVNPQNTLQYLTGAGAVSPEIAQALERHVDPQGQMSQAQKTMAAIQAAPNDEAKFGMMQHYRSKFNVHSAAARAAMDRGEMGNAAIHATKAFSYAPTGKDIKFAPTDGGLLMQAQPMGGGQQSFDDGGAVLPETTDDILAAHAAEDDPYQAVPISPNQANTIFTAGYDKPIDDWGSLFSTLKDAQPGQLNSDRVSPYEPGPMPRKADIGWRRPAAVPIFKPSVDLPNEAIPGSAPGSSEATSGRTANTAPATQPQTNEAVTPEQAAATQEQAPADAAPSANFMEAGRKPWGEDAREPPSQPATRNKSEDENDPYTKRLNRARQLGNELYGWASQGDQRSKFIADQMGGYFKGEDAQAKEGAKQDRLDKRATASQEARRAVIEYQEAQKTGRAQYAQAEHNRRQARSDDVRAAIAEHNGKMGMYRTLVNATPSILNDRDKMSDIVSDIASTTGIPARDVMDELAGSGSQQPKRIDTSTGQQRSSQPSAPKIGEVRNGFRFNGGDPSLKQNWQKVQ